MHDLFCHLRLTYFSSLADAEGSGCESDLDGLVCVQHDAEGSM